MADLNELISLLGRQDEYGGTDSSVIDLKNLMLCDIPDFLDPSKDEEMVDDEVIKNFDDLLEQLTDTTEVEDYVQSVVDLMSAQLNGNSATPDKDSVLKDSEKSDGEKPESVIDVLNTEKFLWVRFGDNDKGDGISRNLRLKQTIGLAYDKDTDKSTEEPSDYIWSPIDDNDRGLKEPSPKKTYTWVKFKDEEDARQMDDAPKKTTKLIGIAINKTNPVKSDNEEDYVWTPVEGLDEDEGISINNGEFKDEIQDSESSSSDADTGQGQGSGDSDKDKDSSDNSKDKDDDNTNKGKAQPCKSVIVEFAADTIKYSHEPFVWNVVPGQSIDSSTIIAYCKQKNKIVPVKSIFSKGVVRKDENDGDFWRCWKTVTSRHIVIDCVEKDPKSDGGSKVDFSALYDNNNLLQEIGDKLQDTGDIFDVVTNHFIYVTYLHLLYYFGVPVKSITMSSTDEETGMTKYWKEWETIPESQKPEVVFSEFINNVYKPRVQRYRDEMQKAASVDAIKATKGNPKKLKKVAQKCVDLTNEYFEDIVYLYRNCHKYFRTVKFDPEYLRTWKVLDKLDFELGVLEDDNFLHIIRERVYKAFVYDIDDKNEDVEFFDRYINYHYYYRRDIERMNMPDSKEPETFKPYYGTNVRDLEEYRNYGTYYDRLVSMGLETDTYRELDGECDVHEDGEHRRGIVEDGFKYYMENSIIDDDVASNVVVHKITAALPGETISDYFEHVSRELFNTERYWIFRFKSLCDYVTVEHPHGNDQRWKIAEEVYRFDQLLNCMVGFYRTHAASNIDGSKKKQDYFKTELSKYFKEIAQWPEPTTYYYEPTHETFEEHYTFLNVDEMEGLYEREKGDAYKDQGSRLGDLAQVNDYIEGDNAYTGYVSAFETDATVNEDEDYVNDLEDSPIFGANMMNPSKLSQEMDSMVGTLASQGLALGVYKGPSDSGDSVGDGNGEDGVSDAGSEGIGGDGTDSGLGGSGSSDNGNDGMNGNGTNTSVNTDGREGNGDGNGRGGDGGGLGNDPNSSDDDVDDGYNKSPQEKDTTKEECSTDISKYKYWVKYFSLATLATMMFLGCGIPLPFMACIPLPCIYIPITVIALNKVGMIIVIGITIRGAYVGPIMLFVNLKSAENSMLIPVTMSMAILMEMMQQKVDAISQMAMQSAAAETVSVKGLLAAQMKMAKEYDIKMKELKEMNVEGKQSIIDNFRQDTGEDTRQTVTRLKTEVVEESAVAVDETKNIVSDAKKESENVLEVDMGSGNTKKTSDTNLVSASIK